MSARKDGKLVRLQESKQVEIELGEATSLMDRAEQVRRAFDLKFPAPETEYWPVDVYEAFVICRKEAKYYKTAYRAVGGKIEFDDDLQEVEQEFLPTRESGAVMISGEIEVKGGEVEIKAVEKPDNAIALPVGEVDFRESESGLLICGELQEAAREDDKGWAWDVTVIRVGRTVTRTDPKGNRFVRDYTREALTESIPLFEGVSVFAFSEKEHASNPGAKGIRDSVGFLENVRMEGDEMRATLRLYESEDWLKTRLLGLDKVARLEKIGLSIDAGGKGEWVAEANVAVFKVKTLQMVSSVDVVHSPAAGGKFNRLVASTAEDNMGLEQILELIRNARPALLESVDLEAITIEQAQEILTEALNTPEVKEVEKKEEKTEPVKETAQPNSGDELALVQETLKETQNMVAQMNCENVLTARLNESKLPVPVITKLRAEFSGTVFETSSLEESITAEKEMIQALLGDSNMPKSFGGEGHVEITQEEKDKHIHAMESMIWGSQGRNHPNYPEHLKDVTPFSSLKRAYREISGFHDSTDREIFFECQHMAPPFDVMESGKGSRLYEAWENKRLTESLQTSDFGQMLGDSVARRMIAEYSLPGLQDWRKIVSDVSSSPDFRTNHRMRMGGYGTLSTVSEQATYQSLTSPSDEEETFAVAKRGGLEDVTFEMIKNDDVGALRRIPQKLGRAAGQTLYRHVFDILEDNGTLADAVALVASATHVNLISGALTNATLSEGRRLMMDQTAYGNTTELLMNQPRFIVFPTELAEETWQLVQGWGQGQGEHDSANRNANFHTSYNLERIEVNYFAVATDFWLIGDPALVPTIEVSFLDGREEPELFVQDQPNVGSAFTADKITYKIRHIYGSTALDYRGVAGYIA